jgi:hypothetical protein
VKYPDWNVACANANAGVKRTASEKMIFFMVSKIYL